MIKMLDNQDIDRLKTIFATKADFDKLETEVVKLILEVNRIHVTLDVILKKMDRPWQDEMLENHEKRIHRLELGRIDN